MSTTESVESVESLSQEIVVELSTVLAALKQFDCADLFKVIKAATMEAEKRSKSESKPKKDPSAPKQPTPKQLQKSTAWVKFTLMNATQVGWEEFIVCNRKSGEEILMPASVEKDGKHVYPNGKEMILTHAMSLSKQRWAPKAKEGTHEELYNEFSASFDAQIAMEPEELEKCAEELPPIVRKTAEEKAAELAAKKAELEEAKAVAKMARESAAELKKQAKAAEKESEKAKKAAAKAPKVPAAAVKVPVVVKVAAPVAVKAAEKPVEVAVVAVKAAEKPVEVKVPVAATSNGPLGKLLNQSVAKAAAKEPAVVPAKAPTGVWRNRPQAVKPVVWSCPADGAVHPWTYKGTKYLRNSDHQVWLEEADGGCGDWCGVYLIDDDRIDDSVEEPDFE